MMLNRANPANNTFSSFRYCFLPASPVSLYPAGKIGVILLAEGIGESTAKGGEFVVKVTMDKDKIANVEIAEHSQSENISELAIKQLPTMIVRANEAEGNTISGAAVTSKAIIEAVSNALAQIK